MTRIRSFFLPLLGTTALILALPSGAAAQTTAIVQNTAPTDADRLANEVRTLAADPRNMAALLAAGKLSTKLGDTEAALAFYSRAESVEPGNPRILAGRGSVMVRLERPGEALRLFNEAERRGLAPAEYAADRGLAYDLLGAPQLAQRDYRLALANGGNDDETVRRLGLSLGIVGKATESMAVLEPLLTKSDRAAWRARAFVLAMSGDAAGAQKIADSMMPGNMGAALTPFFRRLPGLPVADRAFAVHFGELSPTPSRLADARMAPSVPAYTPEPVQVAAAPVPAKPAARDRRSRSQHQPAAQQRLAAAQPVPTPAPQSLPPAPRYAPPPASSYPAPSAQMAGAPRQPAVPAYSPAPAPSGTAMVQAVPPRPQPSAQVQPLPPRQAPPVQSAPPPVRMAAAEPAPTPRAPIQPARSAVTPISSTTQVPRGTSPDPILAKIIAGINIPASERSIDAVTSTPAPVRPSARPVPVVPKTPPLAEKPARAAPKPDAKDPAKPDAKADPKKKVPAKAEPARIWVQVAGGADEKALAGAWDKVADRAPAAFKGKSGWSTPLRATNRVLAGPFKTNDEAQAFVNQLRKKDIQAFVFTSEAGQKVTRLSKK